MIIHHILVRFRIFKALSTTLSATIGTGNILGVAAAMLIDGPEAVFWM
ncbi:MAG: AGCS family alanine or glycine:cation symporter [Lysobacterales bacterium]|jgi:AGCS family alanine or glycine:cation symporter